MPFWRTIILENTLARWAISAGVFIVVTATLFALRAVFLRRAERRSRAGAATVDNALARVLRKTRGFFPPALGFFAASLVLTLPEKTHHLFEGAALLALLLQGAIWGSEIISLGFERRRSLSADAQAAADPMSGLLRIAFQIALWTTALLVALDNLGVQITTLIAGLGVGGIAVALALQNILGDLFASLSILLDKPFVVGDFIVVDAFRGRVERIGLKTTRIRSLSGEQLVLSNGDLLKSRIQNFERLRERRIAFGLDIVYGTPAEKLEAIPDLIRSVIESIPRARFDRAHFSALGSASLKFEVVYWVTDSDYLVYMDIQQSINLALVRRFREEGIEFAFPTQTVILAH